MLVYVIVRQGGPAGVKDEIKFNFLPAPSFFYKRKKTESRLMMVLDSGAGVGWHSEHWDEVAERPN